MYSASTSRSSSLSLPATAGATTREDLILALQTFKQSLTLRTISSALVLPHAGSSSGDPPSSSSSSLSSSLSRKLRMPWLPSSIVTRDDRMLANRTARGEGGRMGTSSEEGSEKWLARWRRNGHEAPEARAEELGEVGEVGTSFSMSMEVDGMGGSGRLGGGVGGGPTGEMRTDLRPDRSVGVGVGVLGANLASRCEQGEVIGVLVVSAPSSSPRSERERVPGREEMGEGGMGG